MPPILVGWLVDSLSGNIPHFLLVFKNFDIKGILIVLMVLTAVIFLLESLFEWLFNRSFKRIAQKIQHDVRIDLYRKLQNYLNRISRIID